MEDSIIDKKGEKSVKKYICLTPKKAYKIKFRKNHIY